MLTRAICSACLPEGGRHAPGYASYSAHSVLQVACGRDCSLAEDLYGRGSVNAAPAARIRSTLASAHQVPPVRVLPPSYLGGPLLLRVPPWFASRHEFAKSLSARREAAYIWKCCLRYQKCCVYEPQVLRLKFPLYGHESCLG